MHHDAHARFIYDGVQIKFCGASEDDHISRIMRGSGTFYERDVLEKIRHRVIARGRPGAAVDVGAFIGTHSVYFGKFCGCDPVISFEANPSTFAILTENIRVNDLRNSVVGINKALGSKLGYGHLVEGAKNNKGSTSVDFISEDTVGHIVVSTLDRELSGKEGKLFEVTLIKIDVEGAEIQVLKGSKKTIENYKPILCIEVHTFKNLLSVMWLMRTHKYCVIDCLGFSPTYVLEPLEESNLRRVIANFLWLFRTIAPTKTLKDWLRRIAQLLGPEK